MAVNNARSGIENAMNIVQCVSIAPLPASSAPFQASHFHCQLLLSQLHLLPACYHGTALALA
jgi:hypothetical protein